MERFVAPTRLWRSRFVAPAACLSLSLMASDVRAATIGTPQTMSFPGTVATFCTITATGGNLAVKEDRSQLTSDSAELGNHIGTRTAGSFSVSSNVPQGIVVVSAPTLSGGTSATTSELKVGSGSYAASATVSLANGIVGSTPVNVKFSTTNNSNILAASLWEV